MSEENLQAAEQATEETTTVETVVETVVETPAPVVEEVKVEEPKAKKSTKKEEPAAEEVVVVVPAESYAQCAPETVQRPGRHEMYAVAPVEFGVRRKL